MMGLLGQSFGRRGFLGKLSSGFMGAFYLARTQGLEQIVASSITQTQKTISFDEASARESYARAVKTYKNRYSVI